MDAEVDITMTRIPATVSGVQPVRMLPLPRQVLHMVDLHAQRLPQDAALTTIGIHTHAHAKQQPPHVSHQPMAVVPIIIGIVHHAPANMQVRLLQPVYLPHTDADQITTGILDHVHVNHQVDRVA